LLPALEVWSASMAEALPPSADGRGDSLLLTPASHGTDGFFVAVLERKT
jgi:16S rRNA (cytosine967-C5)-methyltransferase